MIPAGYTFRNILQHKVTSALTILGISLVVFVFSGSLMLSHGLKATLVATGTDGNVIAIRKSSQTEVMSIVDYEQARILATSPEIARDENDAPFLTNEIYVLIGLKSRSNGDEAQVVVRGVTPNSMKLRPMIKMVEGRMWNDPGSEIIAGSEAAKRFIGCGLGEQVRFGARQWTVVGIFDAGGTGFDSELRCEINQATDAFRRPVYSSVTFRLADTSGFAAFKQKIEDDRRLTLEIKQEKEYYEAQSRYTTTFISIAGSVISIVFSLGAIIGAMITMYAAVANRVKEIGTLRALGFSRFSILTSFLTESMLIALSGGALGVLAAYFLGFFRISTTNWDTFSEIAFNFEMSWAIAISALVFSLLMGIIGGFLPAVRAARLKIIDTLRA
nr:ABC transporter permease [candidate division Zixibacteria bacterium]